MATGDIVVDTGDTNASSKAGAAEIYTQARVEELITGECLVECSEPEKGMLLLKREVPDESSLYQDQTGNAESPERG